MFTTPQPQAPQTVRATIQWLLRLGRPPLPECPIEAAKQGKEPKQPCFLDGKYLKTVSWRQWQQIQPLQEILDAWFSNPKTGIGTLGGWNGKHWLGWIDFDRKDFPSPDTCARTIQEWLEKYPLLETAPMFRTPSGGYRFLVAFSREPENFKANSGFSLKSDGSYHVGELLSKNGGHTLLPPTVGITGVAYEWMQWSEYPPVFEQPEDIGIYPLIKKAESEPTTLQLPRRSNLLGDTQLTDLLNNDILPRFSAQQAFNWSGHNLKEYPGGKHKGNCPWHESKSGTAFYCEQKNGVWLWRCPACEIGGGVVEYRHRLAGGNGSPRGREFVEIVQQLAWEVGVSIPSSLERKSGNSSQPSNKVIPHPTALRSTLNSEELFKRIDNLIEQELPESELTLKLSDLAREAERHPKEVRSIYNARLKCLLHEATVLRSRLALTPTRLALTPNCSVRRLMAVKGGLLKNAIALRALLNTIAFDRNAIAFDQNSITPIERKKSHWLRSLMTYSINTIAPPPSSMSLILMILSQRICLSNPQFLIEPIEKQMKP